MKKYIKPQAKPHTIVIGASLLSLSAHNEEGNGIQRSKDFLEYIGNEGEE